MTGEYTIFIDPEVENIGSVTFTLYSVPADYSGTISIGGTSSSVTTTSPGQNARLTFSGNENQRMSLKVPNSTLGWAYITIPKPDGTPWLAEWVTNGAYIDVRALPATGNYTMLIDPEETNIGSMSLVLYDVPADASASISIGGPPVTVTNTVPGQNVRTTFSGGAGQNVALTLSNVTSAWIQVSILKPDGTALVAPRWISSSGGTVTAALPVAGVYTILTDPEVTNTGNTTLSLTENTGGSSLIQRAVDERAASAQQGVVSGKGGPRGPRMAAERRAHFESRANRGGDVRRHTQARVKAALENMLHERRSAQSRGREGLTDGGNVTQTSGAEEWLPDEYNLQGGDWRSRRPNSPWQQVRPLQAPRGVTALAGQVLTLNGLPLKNVTLSIKGKKTRTDAKGRFLLSPIGTGNPKLAIDGRSASRPGRSYGVFEASARVADGKTNVLPFTIWMPKLDVEHAVSIPSPTTRDVVLTTPHIPGLEVRIPKGTTIRDIDGKAVTRLGITPIPVDQPPFPLPSSVQVPIYFTVQPGGGHIIPHGAQIVYPNYKRAAPGTRVNFWHYEPEMKGYEPDARGWYVYGQGSVSRDGKQVVPDPKTRIYQFTGAMINVPGYSPPAAGPVPGNNTSDGDPVDLSTGLFVLEKTDLVLPDALRVSLSRTYRPNDNANRVFGVGATHPYELFLWSANQWQETDLILPDGGRVHYVRTSSGTGFQDAVFEHNSTPTAFYKSTIRWNGNGWDLKLRDGTTYVFGNMAPLQAIRDRYGNQITLTRANGQSGNIASIRTHNGRWIRFTYDASNRITIAKDNTGRYVGYQYDATGRLWKVTDPDGGVTEYTYDAAHRMLSIKDAKGLVFLTNEYDTNGRVTRQTQADGTTYGFAYTLGANGKVTRTDVTDPRGNVRRVTFNAAGYTLTDAYAAGTPLQQSVTYERQAGTNRVLSVTDQLGRRSDFTYDAMGNVIRVTDLAGTPGAVSTSYTYEPKYNQVLSVTDPLNHTNSFEYDARGNLIKVTDALGHHTTLAYNLLDQPVSVMDPLGKTTRFNYQSGDLVSVTDPLGRTTSHFLDGAGKLITARDALGTTVRYDYDAMNRPVRVTDPLGGSTAVAYDANGNLLSLTDARGNATTYTYDNMDRLRTRKDPLLTTESYTYDAAGNVTRYTDRKGHDTAFEFDALDGLTKITYADGSTTNYTYDLGDRLTQVVDSLSGTMTYEYDTLDRLLSETTPLGKVSYAYDAAGRPTGMTVTGQPPVAYTYDAGDRLTQITQGSSTASVSYDNADRPTTTTLPNSVSMYYSYDSASQLTGITYKLGATTMGDLTYAYDATGQLTKTDGSYARTSIPAPMSGATYNANNQLTQRGATTFTYDLNGNMTSDGTSTYTWDARDQLSTITGGSPASFGYDSFGRRMSKTINGVTTQYLYDGENAVQELGGGVPVSNTLTGLGTDSFITRTDSNGSRTLLTDALGSTLGLVDATGTMRTEYTYEPFGKTTVTGETGSNPHQYTGRENDGTGLYYYRARYYNPTLGRFISEDPVGFGGGDTNLYAYVSNSPTNYTDSSGLSIDAVVDGAFIAKDVYDVVTGGRKNRAKNLKTLGLDVVSAFIPGVVGLGRASKAVDDAVDAAKGVCRNSFSADTLVATEDGEEPISQIAIGDEVLAYDEATGKTSVYIVTDTISHRDAIIEHLTIDGERLATTLEHPFYTRELGWVEAGYLWRGAHIRKLDGNYGTVDAVELVRRSQKMYNLTVDEAHTFFVGDGRWLVHNVDICDNVTRLPDDAINPPKQRGDAPTSKVDSKPIEIHHAGQNPDGPFVELPQQEHRGPGKHAANHPDKKSRIDRREWQKDRKRYWKGEWDRGRWGPR